MLLLELQEFARCNLFIPGILEWFISSSSNAGSEDCCRGWKNGTTCRAGAFAIAST